VVPDIQKELRFFICRVKKLQKARLLDPESEDSTFLQNLLNL
jgi:hypothetical protein